MPLFQKSLRSDINPEIVQYLSSVQDPSELNEKDIVSYYFTRHLLFSKMKQENIKVKEEVLCYFVDIPKVIWLFIVMFERSTFWIQNISC